MVRQRGAKAGPGRLKLCRKDLSEMLLGRAEGETSLSFFISSSRCQCCVCAQKTKTYCVCVCVVHQACWKLI